MSDPYLNIVALHGLLLKAVIKLTKLDDLITAVCAVYSGVYVAAVVHHADRVLVTDDGRIPMVEVDDAVSVKDASFMTDYYWLLKVGKLFSANVHFCVHLDLILLSMHFVATTSCCEFCARTYYAARLARALYVIATLYTWQVACTWKDVERLRGRLERICSSETLQFRYRLLQAVAQLQVV